MPSGPGQSPFAHPFHSQLLPQVVHAVNNLFQDKRFLGGPPRSGAETVETAKGRFFDKFRKRPWGRENKEQNHRFFTKNSLQKPDFCLFSRFYPIKPQAYQRHTFPIRPRFFFVFFSETLDKKKILGYI
jgi:hypothetical protein